MTTLTKASLTEHLIGEVDHLSRRDATRLIELFFNEISLALTAGHPIKLSGFGNFELHDKNERPGRNPRTGESVPVDARRVVTFHSGQKLRAQVVDYKDRVGAMNQTADETEE